MKFDLKILFWNLNSIRYIILELQVIIQKIKIDIILENETRLLNTKYDTTNNRTYRNDLPSVRGKSDGTTILIHWRITHQPETLKDRLTKILCPPSTYIGNLQTASRSFNNWLSTDKYQRNISTPNTSYETVTPQMPLKKPFSTVFNIPTTSSVLQLLPHTS